MSSYPRFPTRLPIIHPFTNKIARYGCVVAVEPPSNKKLIAASMVDGILRSKVVTKKPTPAASFGRPSEKLRDVQEDVSKPGRCQPSRSPKRPPSFSTPRTLSR